MFILTKQSDQQSNKNWGHGKCFP